MSIPIQSLSDEYDYFINKYPPNELTLASLETFERHYCSFMLAGVKRFLMTYQNDGSLYTCHLTDTRLIIEPCKISGAEILAMKFIPKLINNTFGDDSSPLVEGYIKGTVKANVKKMSVVKNMYNNGSFIIVPYSDIEQFKMVFAAIFNFKTKDGSEHLFKANKLPRNILQIFVLPKYSQDFVALGNNLLEAYKRKQQEIERQKQEIERQRKEAGLRKIFLDKINSNFLNRQNYKNNQDTLISGENRTLDKSKKLIKKIIIDLVIFSFGISFFLVLAYTLLISPSTEFRSLYFFLV